MDKTFVSRGGLKLQHALDKFKIDVKGKTALDVGSSTGGFVDCLLKNGASKIYSVDTSYGELAWTLRNDIRVIVMERTNILHLNELPEQVDLITIDAGWTKLELVLPAVQKFLKDNGQIIALLKPHYETSQKDLIKGILPENLLLEVRDKVIQNLESLGFKVTKCIQSPIKGGGGNVEYLIFIEN